jgi:hypothetical protein
MKEMMKGDKVSSTKRFVPALLHAAPGRSHLAKLKTSYLSLSCPNNPGSPPDTARRWPEVALPDPTVVELNPHSVGRIDGALVSRVDPDPAVRRSQIGPRTVRFSGLSHKIHVIPVLGDEGWSA